VEAYLPSEKIAIAVAVTFGEESFDDQENYLDDGQAAKSILSEKRAS
jgi:hypothetical protein